MEEKKMNKKRNKYGFTLIELLVVISIIATLASFLIVAVKGGRIKVRDAERISTLDSFRKGLELYYLQYGYYPKLNSTNIRSNWGNLLDMLKNEGLLSEADYTNKNIGYLDSIITEAHAAVSTWIQDPLYPKYFQGSSGSHNQYSYGYMPSGPASDPDKFAQNFRLRVKLENSNSPYLDSSLDGLFIYSEINPHATDNYSCSKAKAFYCIGPENNFSSFIPGKPVIYLYPTSKQEISVKIQPKNIHESVPDYKDGWKVIASPNGTLYNPTDQEEYPYLFWEGESDEPVINRGFGFVIKSQNVENFLTEKLQLLGLNEKETDDFIEFWAPRMKKKNYTYVYFMPQKDFDELVPIKIEPKPDTIIRVYMLFASIDMPINVKEQKITTPERNGFTVVEWGGDLKEIK